MGRSGPGVEVRATSIRIAFKDAVGQTQRHTLRDNGQVAKPTQANIKRAHRLAAEIRERVRLGTFSMAEYFPEAGVAGAPLTVGAQLDLWLGLQSALEPSTLRGYEIAVRWWQARMGNEPLRAVKHSTILAALATQPMWTGKTRNNVVSVLRQAIQLALRDQIITNNPLDGLEAAPHQKRLPDPFTLEEVELILTDMRKHYPAQIGNYFEFKFFTGLRTSESLGLRWGAIDWRHGSMVISEGVVQGKHKDRTKTNVARTVQLNSRAIATLQAQKPHTFLAGDWVFTDPRSGERWQSDRAPREVYWQHTLKRLGIRYRSPYETRHTYATAMLMGGNRPAWAARQLGHSVVMFLSVYAKWIDGSHDDAEMGRLESFLSSPATPQKTAK